MNTHFDEIFILFTKVLTSNKNNAAWEKNILRLSYYFELLCKL